MFKLGCVSVNKRRIHQKKLWGALAAPVKPLGGPNSDHSHRNAMSPLTQCVNYRSHCDTIATSRSLHKIFWSHYASGHCKWPDSTMNPNWRPPLSWILTAILVKWRFCHEKLAGFHLCDLLKCTPVSNPSNLVKLWLFFRYLWW